MSVIIADGRCYLSWVRIYIEDKIEFLNWIHNLAEKYQITIACLNHQMIAGQAHIETAVIHALRNREEGRAIAKTPEMEILLYCAGTRQTSEVYRFSLVNGENDICLCIIPPDKKCLSELFSRIEELKEKLNDMSAKKKVDIMEWFNISQKELDLVGEDRLIDLVRERSALLTVNH
jgi:KEOPS complex subunit Cgi121